MGCRRYFALGLLVCAVGAQGPRIPADEMTLAAKPFSPVLTFHSDSSLVQLTVVVRDAKGVPVAGLKQSDFELLEDGKPRPISAFVADEQPGAVTTAAVPATPAAPAAVVVAVPAPVRRPHAVAMYFDDLHTSGPDLAQARKAADTYIDTGIRPGDKIAVVSSVPASTIDFTDDMAKVKKVIAGISPHSRIGADGGCPLITPAQAYEIYLHFSASLDEYQLALQQALICNPGMQSSQASSMVRAKAEMVWAETEAQSQAALTSIEALVRYVGRQPGDKTILLASAGFLTPSLQKQLGKLVDAALHAGVTINTIDPKGLYAYSTGQPMGFNFDDPLIPGNPQLDSYRDASQGRDDMELTDVMQQLADGTGGTFIQNTNALPAGFQQLAAPPDVTYLMGFTAEGIKPDGSFHSLSVRVTAPGRFGVQTRPGFYAPEPKEAKAAAATEISAEIQQSLNTETYAKDEAAGFPTRITPEVKNNPTTGLPQVHVIFQVDPRPLAWKKANGRNNDELIFVAALLDAEGRFIQGEQGVMNLALKDGTLAEISQPGAGLTTALPINVSPGTYQLRTIIFESGKRSLATATQPLQVP